MMKKISAAIFTAVLLAAFTSAGAAGEPKEKQAVKRTAFRKTVQGEVGGIGPDFISITYEANEATGYSRDVLLSFDPGNMLIQNKKALKDIKAGDIAAVEYDEVTEDGRMVRIARKIIFVKAADKATEYSTFDSESFVPPEPAEPAETKEDKGENTDE